MKRDRIIIDFDSSIEPAEALAKVLLVVENGFVSEAAGVPHYCWGTVFKDGRKVFARQKKKGQRSNSFRVDQ